MTEISGRFEQEYARTYGHILPGHPIDFVNLRVIGAVPSRGAKRLLPAPRAASMPRPRERQAYFGAHIGLVPTAVIDRTGLTGAPRPGPLIIEEYEGTTVIPPGATASVDAHANIIVKL